MIYHYQQHTEPWLIVICKAYIYAIVRHMHRPCMQGIETGRGGGRAEHRK